MTDDPIHHSQLRAIERLGWTTQQLYIAAMGFGHVGTIEDVREHLRTGHHLPHEKSTFIAAALWDAEITAHGH